MTANHPQEAAGARLAGERAESEVRYAETANGAQTGTERFVPGWAPHMDAYAKNFPTPTPAPVPADVREQIAAALAGAIESELDQFFRDHPEEPRNSPWVLGMRDAAEAVRRSDAALRVPAIAEALTAAAEVQRLRDELDTVKRHMDARRIELLRVNERRAEEAAALDPQEQP